eukprot:1054969_1
MGTKHHNTKQSPMTFSNANYHEIPSKTYHSNGIKLESIVTHYINHQSDHVIYYGGVSTLIFGLFRKGEESDVISPINANIVPNAAQNLNLNINTFHLQLEYNHKASNTGMTGSTRIYCTLFNHSHIHSPSISNLTRKYQMTLVWIKVYQLNILKNKLPQILCMKHDPLSTHIDPFAHQTNSHIDRIINSLNINTFNTINIIDQFAPSTNPILILYIKSKW